MSETTVAVMANGHAMATEREGRVDFTAEQREMIREQFAPGATDLEFQVLLEVAKARNLSPLKRQIFFVSRWNKKKNRDEWSVQVSIDGMRSIAERTGVYDGQDEPEFEFAGNSQVPDVARVRVYRKDVSRPFVGVARWREFAQNDGPLWGKMPTIMLAKCAESQALRKAFPETFSGLYSEEEMGQATNDAPAPAPPPRRGAPPREAPRQQVVEEASEVDADQVESERLVAAAGRASSLTELRGLLKASQALPEQPPSLRGAVRVAALLRRMDLAVALGELGALTKEAASYKGQIKAALAARLEARRAALAGEVVEVEQVEAGRQPGEEG